MWRASHGRARKHATVCGPSVASCRQGLLRELNPGPLAPEARIMPLDQAANDDVPERETPECTLQWEDTQPASD